MHASREEMLALQQADLPADAGAGGAARAAAAAPQPRAPRLPQDRARVAVVRRRARRAEVPQPAPVEARDHGGRRHLGVGGELRPLHAAVRVRDGEPVLEGAVVGVHRRHRRGHAVLPGVRRRHRSRAPGEHRGRRRVGRRPLRLRPRVRGVPPAPLRARSRRRRRSSCSATRATTTTRRRRGSSTRCASAAATSTGSTPSRAATGTPATRSSPSTASYCDGVFECRNLRQLERFVATIAEA